jgi:HK97 family phage major capsid protein
MNAEAYLRGQIEKRIDEAKSVVASAEEAGRGLNDNERAHVEALTGQADELRSQLSEVTSARELREGIDRLGKGFAAPTKAVEYSAPAPVSIGDAIVRSPEYKSLLARGTSGPFSFSVEVGTKANETVTQEGVPAPDYVPGIQRLMDAVADSQRLSVVDVLPQAQTNSNRVTYIAETTSTNSAAAAAEASGTAAQSVLIHGETHVPVEKITTLLYASDEMLMDGPAFRSYLDGRLVEYVRFEEEDEVINGDGTTPNLNGLLTAVTQTQALGADGYADCIYKAKTDVRVGTYGNMEPTHILIHPTDWQTIRLSKDANDRYLMDLGPWSAAGASEPGLWGLTPLITQRIAQGTALVGAFTNPAAVQLFRRSGVTVDVTNSHASTFANGLVTIRATSRLALVTYQIGAFSEVTGL